MKFRLQDQKIPWSTGLLLAYLLSQVSPVHPFSHVQWKDSPSTIHIPLCKHGLGWQGSRSKIETNRNLYK